MTLKGKGKGQCFRGTGSPGHPVSGHVKNPLHDLTGKRVAGKLTNEEWALSTSKQPVWLPWKFGRETALLFLMNSKEGPGPNPLSATVATAHILCRAAEKRDGRQISECWCVLVTSCLSQQSPSGEGWSQVDAHQVASKDRRNTAFLREGVVCSLQAELTCKSLLFLEFCRPEKNACFWIDHRSCKGAAFIVNRSGPHLYQAWSFKNKYTSIFIPIY